ncbi:MAG TPA: tetraacyldisaccharide 4'-kinase [Phycisphaerales bacterium]|nr:tetraacyldisaccharide 4'-kinase [Phycisphaerales bacterium]
MGGGRLYSLIKVFLKPIQVVYCSAVARRNAAFDRGRRVVTFDRPVISVGNVSVGGTGKSPMVAHILHLLVGAGRRPCVAMRGYGSSRRRDGRSDEAEEYRAIFPGLPVVAQPNRTLGLMELFATPEGESVDCIVLDDGFQHRRIARQLDIVLLDASKRPLEDEPLPIGRLREPMASLRRADVVAVMHAEAVVEAEVTRIVNEVMALNPGVLVVVGEHRWTGVDVLGVDGFQPVSWLAGKRVLPVCAIGNPAPFLAKVEAEAGDVLTPIVLRDHDPYSTRTVRRLIRSATGAEAMVTTAKDWAKLKSVPAADWPCPVVRPRLEVFLRSGGDALAEKVLSAAARLPE